MSPRISERARRVPPSPIRMLMPLADGARRRGVEVLHLNIGQPDLPTPEPMRRRLERTPEVVAYTPSGGTPEYLDFLHGYYRACGLEVHPDEVIATIGGSEALLFAFMAAAESGDEALVAEPYYTNYNAFAAMAGVRLVPLTARGEDGFHLPPPEAWERALTPRTRLAVLCNPNNPTGTVYREEEVRWLAEFCRDRGLFLVADEVYREFAYDGRRATSVLELAGHEAHVIMADSLSKRFSACGLRVGALVTRNREVHQACLRMAQGRLSPPGLGQIAAAGAAELGPDYFRALVAEYQARRDVLYAGLRSIPGVFLRKPEGAFYFVARLPVGDAGDFARFLLADFAHDGATVMVAPAEGFYGTPGLGRDEARIAYVLARPALERAVEVLRAALAAYPGARESAVAAGAEAPEDGGSLPLV